MEPFAVLVALIILIIASAAIYFFIKKKESCPKLPAAIGFWTTPDNSSVPTNITCPTGTVISVQAADFGAPWNNCSWSDVTAQISPAINGKNTFSIPANKSISTYMGIPDPCPGLAKTFAGAYTCLP